MGIGGQGKFYFMGGIFIIFFFKERLPPSPMINSRIALKFFRPEPTYSLRFDPWRATKEGSKAINRDWVNYHACSVSYYIYVVSNLCISKNEFTKFSAKIIAGIYFSEFIYQVAIKLRFR